MRSRTPIRISLIALFLISALVTTVKVASGQSQPPSFPPSGQSGPVSPVTGPAMKAVPPASHKGDPKAGASSRPAAPTPPPPKRDPLQPYLDEILNLREALLLARQQLAAAQLQAAQAQRELDELRQFVQDHHQFGDDFKQYKAVKELAEREAHEKELQAAREKRELEKADREAIRRAAVAQRAARDAVTARAARYRQGGFSSIGLDVYTSKMAFFYETKDVTRTRVDYNSIIGNYVRPYPSTSEIDYSSMTISGSVLNAADSVRNIGVAITFFDENGNQVGQETVQVSNARPDVPYPFTSKIDMALNRAFDSSSVYVLYADVVDVEDASAPATTATSPSAPAPAAPASPDFKTAPGYPKGS